MFTPKSFGLGWVPDLPDHRDYTFACALAHWGKGAKRGAKTQSVPHADPHWPSAGWEAMAADSIEASLASRSHADLRKTLNACKAQAFGDSRRQLLLPRPPQPLPRVDLRPFLSPIEDQGPLSSCTTHAVIALVEYLQIASRAAYVNASRRFLYKATRDLLQWRGDQGAYIRETMKALRLFGVCPERYCRYDLRQYDLQPSPFCYAFAANYQAMSYYRLESLNEIKRTLSQGYPVVFGFTGYESLLSRTAALTGMVSYPTPQGKAIGGHAVLAVGYYDAGHHRRMTGKNVEPDDQGYLIIRNSWGTGWGAGGYGYLPYTYLTGEGDRTKPLADDFWTMTQMKVPEWSDSAAAPFVLQRGRHSPQSGSPVTFSHGVAAIQSTPMPALGGGSPLDEGDFGPWGHPARAGTGRGLVAYATWDDGGAEPDEGEGGAQPDEGGGGAPVG